MSLSRRSFLRLSGAGLLALPFLALTGPNATAADLPAAKESDPLPKSLKYCENAHKPTKSCADRKKPEKKDQFCHNCQLYTKLAGEKDQETGKCLLMPKYAVSGNGWCMSWVKKPG